MNIRCDKYEWNFDEETGQLTCKRHGLTWHNETGDSAVLALLTRACELKEELEDIKGSRTLKIWDSVPEY